MPADDLVLNVRQIAGYTPVSNAPSSAAILMQIGGLGGAYASISPGALVGTALAFPGGDMVIGGGVSALSVQGGTAQFSNGAFGVLEAQAACVVNLSATFGSIGGVRIATAADLAALAAATVTSFNGRTGAVGLWLQDIINAGGAPNFSPVFGGCPRAVTPPPTSNSSRLATTAFVTNALGALTLDFAPLDSPNFTGVPTAPTAALGASDGQIATTAFVQNAVTASTTGVASFNTRTGAVVLTAADITAAGGAVLASPAFTGTPTAPTPPPGDNSTRLATTAFVMTGAGYAPLASPAFTGIPTAPTPTPGTNSVQLATTAFVMAAIAAVDSGVVTFNGRGGAVMLLANDISGASGALLASPAFTGAPTAPTPPPGDNSTRIATTAFLATLTGFAPLASPAFTGIPTAPTAAAGTNSLQLASTAFVQNAIAASTSGVSTWNGRSGAVTLQANDLSAAGGALLASPLFTGTPSAPTAALGTGTTQLATCAYVMNALAGYLPLTGGSLSGGLAVNGPLTTSAHLTGTTAQGNLTVNMTAVGSGAAGPATAQAGAYIYATKDNWSTASAAVGQVDGLDIQVRQGGANSDTGGIDINVAGTGNGFLCAMETLVERQPLGGGAATFAIDLQFAGMNPPTSSYLGLLFNALAGNLSSAISVQNNAGSAWGNVLTNIKNGVTNLTIADTGSIGCTNLGVNVPSGNWAQFALSCAAGQARQIVGSTGSQIRWQILLGDDAAESGADAGSNFQIDAFSDGQTQRSAMSLNRANLNAIFGGGLGGAGFMCQAGSSGARSGQTFSFDWISPYFNVYVGSTLIGEMTPTSDYRVKKNVEALGGMWDRVKALRPVSFEHCGWTPSGASAQLFKEDGVERWGFIAHELQETLTPSAASGVKDAPNALQSPNPWTVIATITRALQEAMARIETLEARMT
jgi:hypothetical protein